MKINSCPRVDGKPCKHKYERLGFPCWKTKLRSNRVKVMKKPDGPRKSNKKQAQTISAPPSAGLGGASRPNIWFGLVSCCFSWAHQAFA